MLSTHPCVSPLFDCVEIVLIFCIIQIGLMLFVWLPLDLCSFFVVMLAKSSTLSSAVSLNVMLVILIHVCVRLVGRRCCVFWGVVCTGYTLHHTPRVNTWKREKQRTTKTDEIIHDACSRNCFETFFDCCFCYEYFARLINGICV